MNQFSQFTFNTTSVSLYGNLSKPFVLCSDVLVKCLGHSMIQDSHYFRDNRTNTDLFLFDKNVWYFTQTGLVETLKRSHKKNAKAVLRAFEYRITEMLKE